MAGAEDYARWIVANADKASTPEFQTVAQAYQLAKGQTRQQQVNANPAAFASAEDRAMADPTSGMGGFDKFRAGAGKAFSDLGRGVAQLAGADNQQAIDQSKGRDAALMNTGAGMAGNITGNVAATLPAAFIPGLNGVVGGSLLGAGLGAVQPVGTGESRGENIAYGAAGGAAIPLAGNLLRAGKSVVEPLTQGGRDTIVGRTLNRVAGENAPAIRQRMANSSELVAGSAPTAAEVAESGGIAAMQRAASAADPEAYATRAMQQNEARVKDLLDLAGTSGERDMHAAARTTAAQDLYKQAYDKGIDITRHPETGQFLPKNVVSGVKGEITQLLKRPSIQDAMASARKLAADEGVNMKDMSGSIKGLDYVKRALDDKIKDAVPGSNQARILGDLKSRLLTTLDRLSPKYAEARTTFTEMSKPINQMDIAQAIADKSIRPLDKTMQAAAFARALRDDTAASATGFNKATLANTLEPEQLARLNNLKSDLARSVQARDLGRGAGSDTMQKLSMANIAEQSGMPKLVNFVSNLPGISRATNWVYRDTDQQVRQRMAQALLDPKESAQLMRAAQGNPQLAKALRSAQRLAIPAGAAGALEMRQ